ncbi:hypothetical protein M0802_009949 [Mischocyttarus mexicanus]|nr:hypothetical protein M0802_009949 [Mischocyttarus mexicanus]
MPRCYMVKKALCNKYITSVAKGFESWGRGRNTPSPTTIQLPVSPIEGTVAPTVAQDITAATGSPIITENNNSKESMSNKEELPMGSVSDSPKVPHIEMATVITYTTSTNAISTPSPIESPNGMKLAATTTIVTTTTTTAAITLTTTTTKTTTMTTMTTMTSSLPTSKTRELVTTNLSASHCSPLNDSIKSSCIPTRYCTTSENTSKHLNDDVKIRLTSCCNNNNNNINNNNNNNINNNNISSSNVSSMFKDRSPAETEAAHDLLELSRSLPPLPPPSVAIGPQSVIETPATDVQEMTVYQPVEQPIYQVNTIDLTSSGTVYHHQPQQQPLPPAAAAAAAAAAASIIYEPTTTIVQQTSGVKAASYTYDTLLVADGRSKNKKLLSLQKTTPEAEPPENLETSKTGRYVCCECEIIILKGSDLMALGLY